MDTRSTNHSDSVTLARCRPGSMFWFLALLFAGLGILCMIAPSISQHPGRSQDVGIVSFFIVVGLLLLLPSLVGMGYLLRAEVAATEAGLRWLTIRGWKTVAWSEVTDFYEKRLQKGQRADVIETQAGNITLQHDMWRHWQALREVVSQRAKHAPNSEWGERGKRPQERWPLVVDYDTPDNRNVGRQGAFLSLMLLVAIVVMGVSLWPKVQRDIAELGWQWGVARVAMLLVLILPMGALLLLATRLQYCSVRERTRQSITATDEGLTYDDGAKRLTMLWKEIDLVYTEPGKGLTRSARHIIVGKQGQFDFNGWLKDSRVLSNLIARRAPTAVEKGLDFYADEEDLDPHDDLNVTSEHVYHYRTRTNRALLWFIAIPVVCGIVMLGAIRAGWSAQQDEAATWGIIVISALPFLWAWWRYRTASIRTDSLGITQYSLSGKRFVSWGEVQDFYLSGDDIATFGNIVGTDKQIHFWIHVSGRERLMLEIARRAVNSRSKEWKKREKAQQNR